MTNIQFGYDPFAQSGQGANRPTAYLVHSPATVDELIEVARVMPWDGLIELARVMWPGYDWHLYAGLTRGLQIAMSNLSRAEVGELARKARQREAEDLRQARARYGLHKEGEQPKDNAQPTQSEHPAVTWRPQKS